MKKTIMSLAVVSAMCCMSAVAAPRSSTMSPLLGDYASFKQDKQDKTMLVYRHKEKKASDYRKFIVEPVVITPSDFRGGPKLSPENIQQLSELFRSVLSDGLKSNYQVTDVAGPGTLRLRFGIRDLIPGKYYMDARGTHEIRPDSDLAAVTFEMEGVDSMTGERVIAIVRNVKSEEVKGANRQQQVQHVSDVFADWVHVLLNRLDQSNIPQ